jgi:hypothetical protein
VVTGSCPAVHVSLASRVEVLALIRCRLGASGVIIARKAVVGGSDFNAAVVSFYLRPSWASADEDRSSDHTCTPTYAIEFAIGNPDVQFFTTVLIDGLLTGAIAYGLWKSKTGWKLTDALIKRIIM